MKKATVLGSVMIGLSIILTASIIISKNIKAADGDFVITDGVLTSYTGSDTQVTVPDSVTEIGSGAFDGTPVETVVLGENVTTIGDGAFSNASNLTEVVTGNGLTTIGNGAFTGSSVGSLYIPSTVTTIDPNAFSGATSFTDYVVDSENAEFSSVDGWLYNHDGSTLVSVPTATSNTTVADTTTNIASGAFNNTDITEITISSGVTTIGDQNWKVSTIYGPSDNTAVQEYVVMVNQATGGTLTYIVNDDGTITPVDPGDVPTPPEDPGDVEDGTVPITRPGGGTATGGATTPTYTDNGDGTITLQDGTKVTSVLSTGSPATLTVKPNTKTNKTYVVAADGTVHEKDATPTTADGFDPLYILCMAFFLCGVAAILFSRQKAAIVVSEEY